MTTNWRAIKWKVAISSMNQISSHYFCHLKLRKLKPLIPKLLQQMCGIDLTIGNSSEVKVPLQFLGRELMIMCN